MEYIHLQGSDVVGVAGRQMAEAAHDMQRAANQISENLHHFQQFMEEWMQRLEAASEKYKETKL